METELAEEISAKEVAEKTVYPVLFAISFSHLMNDTIQSLIPAIYPVIKDSLNLTFTQIGLITLTFQLSASILQPFVGLYTDKKPQPYSLSIGMCVTLIGLIIVSFANSFPLLLLAVAFVGMGSAVFHPEASRLAHMASGGRRGMAQSLFQVGGNAGSSIGPLLAALIVARFGQQNVVWFSLIALLAIVVLFNLGGWYKKNIFRQKVKSHKTVGNLTMAVPRKKVIFAISILLLLIFSKYFYLASMTSYYTFYLIEKFNVSVKDSQLYLFVFLFSVAAGTFLGGPVGDKIGRKYVIWISILGAAPFTLLLPYVDLFWTSVLSVFIGLILASAFSAILVYAQELIPGKVGMIAGLFFGFAFGMGGIGSALLGKLADISGIIYVYKVCAFLPLIGLLTVFLPDVERERKRL